MDWTDYPCRTAGCGHLALVHSSPEANTMKVPCSECECDAYRNDDYALLVADIPGARQPTPE